MSKGGSNTSSVEIPEWLENAAIENINKGRQVSQIGYTPYYGPEVAAFNPMQQQSMQSTGSAASAFGLAPQGFDATAGIPQAQTFAGGIQGYSSIPLFDESMDQFAQARPGQYNAINNMFIDPYSGAAASGNYQATPTQVAQMIDRTPTTQPDYSINIDNSATGGTGGTGGGAEAAYDAIYSNAKSTDLTAGDTFIGDDGNRYVVGYDVGQVDPGLANAVSDRNGLNDLMTTGEALGGIAGNMAQSTLIGRGIEALTGNPVFNSNDAPVTDLGTQAVDTQGLDAATLNANVPQQYQNTNTQGLDAATLNANVPQQYMDSAYGNQETPVVQGGLLGATTTPLPDANIVDLAQQQREAAQLQAQLQAQARAQIAQAEAAAQAQAAAAQAAAEEAAIQRQLEADNIYRESQLAIAAEKKAQEEYDRQMAALQSKSSSSNSGGYTPTTPHSYSQADTLAALEAAKTPIYTNSGYDRPTTRSSSSGSSSSSSSSNSSSNGTYCCTKMRENGDWTSNRRVYKMHKWHFEQPQWWRDGYDVWGKVIANNLLDGKGKFFPSVMNEFYEHRVNKGKVTAKSALAHALMYPAVFTIGMVAKVTGKHITKVTITS